MQEQGAFAGLGILRLEGPAPVFRLTLDHVGAHIFVAACFFADFGISQRLGGGGRRVVARGLLDLGGLFGFGRGVLSGGSTSQRERGRGGPGKYETAQIAKNHGSDVAFHRGIPAWEPAVAPMRAMLPQPQE